jgi:hypothetical protein
MRLELAGPEIGRPAPAPVLAQPYRSHPPPRLGSLQYIAGRLLLGAIQMADSLRSDLADLRHLGQDGPARTKLVREGAAYDAGARRVALYAHYCPTPRISAMVRAQVAEYRRLGFQVVFITMSAAPDAADLAAVAADCGLLIHRRSFGRDFGAWKDAMEVVATRFGAIDELLLTNDSVLGPLFPLDTLFATMRPRPGVWGLTDSFQNGVHLQSFFLLAVGGKAVGDLSGFLSALRLSTGKMRMIRRAELALTPRLLALGNPVCALYGYDAVEAAALDDRAAMLALGAAQPGIFRPPGDTPAQLAEHRMLVRRRLFDFQANPTHHFWATLVRSFGFPFLKTELLLLNPLRLPDVVDWRQLVPEGAPCGVEVIEQHLLEMGRKKR